MLMPSLKTLILACSSVGLLVAMGVLTSCTSSPLVSEPAKGPISDSAVALRPDEPSQLAGPDGNVTIDVADGSVNRSLWLNYHRVPVDQVSPLPTGFTTTPTVFGLTVTTEQGEHLETFSFLKPVNITAFFSQQDLVLADGVTSNIVIQRQNHGSNEWALLPTKVDSTDSTALTQVEKLGIFALTVKIPEPSSPRTSVESFDTRPELTTASAAVSVPTPRSAAVSVPTPPLDGTTELKPVSAPKTTPIPLYRLQATISPDTLGRLETMPAYTGQGYTAGTVVALFARCDVGTLKWSGDMAGALFRKPGLVVIRMNQNRAVSGLCVPPTPTPVPTPTATPVPTPTPTPTPAPTPTPTPVPPPPLKAMFRGDPQHTGAYDSKGVSQFSGLKWRFETYGRVRSSPTIFEETVYFGSEDAHLYAVDTETGRLKWSFKTASWILSSPAVAGHLVYVGSKDGIVYAVDQETGQEEWRFASGGQGFFSSPAIVGELVLIGSRDGNLYALDMVTGQEEWRVKTNYKVNSSPTVFAGMAFFGSEDAHLYAVDILTGQLLWTFKAGAAVRSSPATAEGMVYFGSFDRHLYALDSATGEERWRFFAGGPIVSSPAIAAGTVYFGSEDKNLYALDSLTGSEKWRFKTQSSVRSSPSIAGETVSFVSEDGNLYALDILTGEEIWRYEIVPGPVSRPIQITAGKDEGNRHDTGLVSSPSIAGGVIYVGSQDRHLYAIQ